MENLSPIDDDEDWSADEDENREEENEEEEDTGSLNDEKEDEDLNAWMIAWFIHLNRRNALNANVRNWTTTLSVFSIFISST